MLYLDSSALVKGYLDERGSPTVRQRLRGNERVFTSAISFAEIHAAIGRKFREEELTREAFESARDTFTRDWVIALLTLDLDAKTLSDVPGLVERFPLKGSDAVHLASGIWLRDRLRFSPEFAAGESNLEFWVADKALGRIAAECDLAVFNPETAT